MHKWPKNLYNTNKEAIKRHSKGLKEVVRSKKAAPQITLIKELNPIIKGWCNYYQTMVSKETFNKCDHLLWQKLKTWTKRRHPKKSNDDIMEIGHIIPKSLGGEGCAKK